jgi:signal transduction histidine kinase
MKRLLGKLWPSSLFGQLMLVVALALLVAQSVNTVMLIHGAQARAELEASSMLVARLANQVERRRLSDASAIPAERGGRRRLIVVVTADMPVSSNQFALETELTERAVEYLQGVDPEIRSVRLSIGPIEALPDQLSRKEQRHLLEDRLSRHGEARNPVKAIILNMQLADGNWVSAAAPVRSRGTNPILMLVLQTLILYLAVLIPLALIARRIARPLRQLTRQVRASSFASNSPPIQPQGPSDIRNLIDALNGAQSRVDRMLTEKDVMLGAIGHDLKTPLASLRVRIESVEDEGERQKMADTIDEMVTILDDILMLARLGKQGENHQKTDIGALVEAACADFPEEARLKLVALDHKVTAEVRPVLLKRAIRNLVDNALQYGGNARVSIVAGDCMIDILIDDDGPGIAPDAIDKMFEPFARADASRGRERGGTGLGLTISRAIAAAHNGAVTLHNIPGGGLRAQLSVPSA